MSGRLTSLTGCCWYAGWYGSIAVHEVYFYIFDSLMMLAWIAIMIPLHFGVHLKMLQKELEPALQGGKPSKSLATRGMHGRSADLEMV